MGSILSTHLAALLLLAFAASAYRQSAAGGVIHRLLHCAVTKVLE
jgi:hypothetical protein